MSSGILIILLAVFFVFHLAVLSGLLPEQLVWGGREYTRTQFVSMEIFASLVTLSMIWILAQTIHWFLPVLSDKSLRWALRLMTVWFVLNTAGNLLSVNPLERCFFSGLTALFALLCLNTLLQFKIRDR